MKNRYYRKNKYFQTDRVFCEEILGKFEDSIEKNPDYSREQKDKLITILYHDFSHITKGDFDKAQREKRVLDINF